MKLKALEMFMAAHGDELPPKVVAEALKGKKPRADADPDDDKNHVAGSGKKIDSKYLCKYGDMSEKAPNYVGHIGGKGGY